jgi:glycosyltransferase involved in cell wall biosynthesis
MGVSAEGLQSSMLSAIISTRESERSLVPTLNALFPGVMTGLLAEVIVADGGSRDATQEVADIAGCLFLASEAPLGERLNAAAAASKSRWLLFLTAGSVPDSAWVDAVQSFTAASAGDAAIFRAPGGGPLAALRRVVLGPGPEHGLLIARRTYDAIGGHGAGDNADTALLRKLGRRRIATLPAAITVRQYT